MAKVYRYNRKDGISLCAMQAITDNPTVPAKTLARQIGISHHTVHKVRAELDIPEPRKHRVSPRRLCLYARGDIERVFELLERHGLDDQVTLKQVQRWCGVEA